MMTAATTPAVTATSSRRERKSMLTPSGPLKFGASRPTDSQRTNEVHMTPTPQRHRDGYERPIDDNAPSPAELEGLGPGAPTPEITPELVCWFEREIEGKRP
jgi:hypothetical protein